MDNEKTESQEIREDIAKHAAIEAVGNMEGGRLIKQATQDLVDFSIDRLANGFEMATNDELRSWCATLKANLDLLKLLNGAHDKKLTAMRDLKEIKRFEPEPEED